MAHWRSLAQFLDRHVKFKAVTWAGVLSLLRTNKSELDRYTRGIPRASKTSKFERKLSDFATACNRQRSKSHSVKSIPNDNFMVTCGNFEISIMHITAILSQGVKNRFLCRLRLRDRLAICNRYPYMHFSKSTPAP